MDKNPAKWYAGKRTRNLGLSVTCTGTKYIFGNSNWLSHGFGYHNLLTEMEKLLKETEINLLFLPAPCFCVKDIDGLCKNHLSKAVNDL